MALGADVEVIRAWWTDAHGIAARMREDLNLGEDDVIEFDPYAEGGAPYSMPPTPKLYRGVVPLEKGQRMPKDHATPYEGDPAKKAARAEAMQYIRDYQGKWGFILDLRADPRYGTKWFRLSDRQVEVLLKAKQRDLDYAKNRDADRKAKQTGRDLTCLPEGTTCAAVDNDEGGVTFLVIDHCGPKDKWGNPSKWAGWCFVKQQVGPEVRKIGSQRPGESYVGQWPSLIDRVLADPVAAVIRYGVELGVCGVCGKALTNQESREAGIGPVCRSKL